MTESNPRHEAEDRARRSESLLRMASKVSRLGAWTLELPSFKPTWSEEIFEIYELEQGEAPPLEEAIKFYAPEHRETVRRCVQRCAEDGTPFDFELKLVTAKGNEIWVRAIGEAVRNPHGSIVGIQGAFQDITDLKRAEDREKQLESRLISTLENIAEAFLMLDKDWTVKFINQEGERLIHRRREELLGSNIWDLFPEAVGSTFDRNYRWAVEHRRPVEFEEYFPPLNKWFEIRAFPTDDGIAVYFKNSTEQRRVREELLESERRFRELAEHIQDVFYNYDPIHRRMLYVSPAYASIWGRTPESLYEDALSFLEPVHPEDRSRLESSLERQRQGEPTNTEYRILTPEGRVRWIQDQSYPLFNAEGRLERVVGTARDVTLAKEAEYQLRAGEERFRLLSKAANDAIWDWNLITNELWWNEGFETLFGYSRHEIESTIESWSNRIHPEDHDSVVNEVHAVVDGGGDQWSGEYRFLRKDGTYAFVLDRGHVIRDSTGKAYRMIGGMTDLTERKATEVKLAEQAALLDQANDAILVRDMDNRIIYWNRGAEKVYGWTREEAIGRTVADLLYQGTDQLAHAASAVLQEGEWTGELEQWTKTGERVVVLGRWTLLRNDHGEPKSILAINTDVTESKRLEQHFLRIQRMESIGTLASGIAHDLNNVLAPILMSAQLLSEVVPEGEGRAMLNTITNSAQRGADLIRQVLGFARGVEGKRRRIKPESVAREIQKVVSDTFPKNIALDLHIPPGLWSVNADPTQFHQVLMNLCVNARDAMPQGGRIVLALKNRVVDEVFSGMHLQAQPGPYVVIQVEDTGSGIPKELQEKIFEPFFTTKEVGQGTGLGLSTVFSIVRDHGGFLNLYSEPGKGTKFKVYFPAFDSYDREEAVYIEQTELPRGSGELVLVVDDEENIREVTRKALERFGYRVVTATNGAEAVSIYVQRKDEIAVVLTDMSMPIMDGPAMIVALKAVDPDVRIIGSSGLAANGNVAKAIGARVEHFVPKPYTAEALLSALHQALHPPTPEEDYGEDSRRSPERPHSGCILVIDDEPAILGLVARLLSGQGHEVIQAKNAADGLAALQAPGRTVSLVITDLHMPGQSGIELAQQLQITHPELPIILMSGDSPQSEGAQRIPHKVRVLRKPFDLEEMARVVQEALSG